MTRKSTTAGGASSASSATATRSSLLVGSGDASLAGASSTGGLPIYAHSTATPSSSSIRQYIQRMMDIQQMDLQHALDQMRSLLVFWKNGNMVYKTAYYRKQTKNHWSRDDPAFCFLQICFLTICCLAYCIAFQLSVMESVSFILTSVLWNWLGLGIVLATVHRELANRYCNTTTKKGHVPQSVEWMYAFDIHCNAFFVVFCWLYVFQFFVLPVVLQEGFVALMVANSLYATSLSIYWYMTHLGYRHLPFLQHNTEIFLLPIAAIVTVWVILCAGYPFGFGYNMARVMARFYFLS